MAESVFTEEEASDWHLDAANSTTQMDEVVLCYGKEFAVIRKFAHWS